MTADERKQRPLFSGVMQYFPDALMEVAYASWVGNEQHNPGKPLHWDRSKSTDEHDACARHLSQAGTRDEDGVRHSAKAAWRALALLQKELEAERNISVESVETVRMHRPTIRSVSVATIGAVEFDELAGAAACARNLQSEQQAIHSPDATGDSISPEPWGDLV